MAKPTAIPHAIEKFWLAGLSTDWRGGGTWHDGNDR
jgi:hypothetical protein